MPSIPKSETLSQPDRSRHDPALPSGYRKLFEAFPNGRVDLKHFRRVLKHCMIEEQNVPFRSVAQHEINKVHFVPCPRLFQQPVGRVFERIENIMDMNYCSLAEPRQQLKILEMQVAAGF